ncbi:hypothetical protein SELMODRAFT_44932, partial [Selaginella moellendorffii]
MELKLLLLLLVAILASTASAQCPLSHRIGSSQRSFRACRNLAEQGATLAWTHTSSSNTLDAVFTGTAPSSSGWVAWGINTGPAPVMMGADVFLAFRASNGTAMILTYKLTQDLMTKLPSPGPIGIRVLDKSVDISGNRMKLFVRIQLPRNGSAGSVINHIWNRGAAMQGSSPLPHDTKNDIKSAGSINIASGNAEIVIPHQKLKNRHGIINAVGWGLLLPLGVMSARYLKVFQCADPAWFYMHAFFQSSGYVLGVVGWATGLKLATYAATVRCKHRNLGIAIFVFSTLQVLSLLLRPKKEHKVRKFWNIYHHTLGYATIAMIIVNIFEGFDLLQPDRKWKRTYIGVISSLAALSVILEVVTWVVYLRNKSRRSSQ